MQSLKFPRNLKWANSIKFLVSLAVFCQSTIWMKDFLVFATKSLMSPYYFGPTSAETMLNITDWERTINNFFWRPLESMVPFFGSTQISGVERREGHVKR